MAARYGFVKDPPWGNKTAEATEKKHEEMLPAADIKSGWGTNVESRSGKIRRLR